MLCMGIQGSIVGILMTSISHSCLMTCYINVVNQWNHYRSLRDPKSVVVDLHKLSSCTNVINCPFKIFSGKAKLAHFMQHSSVFHGIERFGKTHQDHEGNLASFLGFDNIISNTEQYSGRRVTSPKLLYLGRQKIMFKFYEFSELIENNFLS